MNTLFLFFARKLFPLVPDTRGYWFKRFLLILAGEKIGDNVRICSSVKIIGDNQLSIGENSFIGHDTLI